MGPWRIHRQSLFGSYAEVRRCRLIILQTVWTSFLFLYYQRFMFYVEKGKFILDKCESYKICLDVFFLTKPRSVSGDYIASHDD